MQLRPGHVTHKRLFLFYKKGKCSVQPVGINMFAKMPQRIAHFLQFPEANLYTRHCLCRTSTTLLADSGADVLMLKRHGGWRSSTVAEGYVDENINNKVNISKKNSKKQYNRQQHAKMIMKNQLFSL